VHFVVQGQALEVVDHRGISKKTRSTFNISEAKSCPNEKRHPKVPFEGQNSLN
jgi:hypothetical protein